jgi:hydrogenase expression/formation protein HypC
MCLAIPGKVLEIENTMARVDFGYGTIRDVDISLVDVEVGKYVLVHTGYAIQVMDEQEADKTLEIWREILDYGKTSSKRDG